MKKAYGKILIIDDDKDVLFTARMILRPLFEEIITETSPKKLESLLDRSAPDLIILDMNFAPGATSGNEGLFWLRKIGDIVPEVPVIMNTAYGGIELAVECMKEGAYDFLVKPWQKEKLITTVRNVIELAESRKKISKLDDTRKTLHEDLSRLQGNLVGESPAFRRLLEKINKVAPTDANVLILGENGTGKELVAREIHYQSNRSSESFVTVDLGALSTSVIESELFGHRKGAFTDARESRAGRFELADRGTLFLDEIGNISPESQSKLLTVLQNRQVTRVGDATPIDIDIRLISATNQPIHEMVLDDRFREDLIYRINTVEITLPPLRDRREDIPLLANHFLGQFSRKYGKQMDISKAALEKMLHYDWPGNIRELQHAIERAVIMADREVIAGDDLFLEKRSVPPNSNSLNVGEMEKSAIRRALEQHGGNVSQAARELGMGRTTNTRSPHEYIR